MKKNDAMKRSKPGPQVVIKQKYVATVQPCNIIFCTQMPFRGERLAMIVAPDLYLDRSS